MRKLQAFGALESLENRLLLDADLAISHLAVSSPAYAGAAVTVTYDITNHGDAATDFPWEDTITLSKSAKPIPAAPPVTVAQTATLNPGDTLHVSQQVILMPVLTGRRYMVVQLNSDQGVTEASPADNTAAAAFTVVAAPTCDLAPTSITVTGSLAVGDPVTIHYHVDNLSTNPTINYYIDQVYYSANAKLDTKDILLADTIQHAMTGDPAAAVAGGAGYDGAIDLTVRSDMLGPGYLIVKVTSVNEGKNKTNDILAVPITVDGSLFAGLTSGQLVLHSQAIPQTLTSYSLGAGNVLNAWVQNYQAPVLGGGGADPGTVNLLSNVAVPQGASKVPLALDTSSLPDGMYNLVLQWKQGAVETYRRTMRVLVVDTVTRVLDKLGDTVGGAHFEDYGMEVGTIGQTLVFHVATNYVDIGTPDHGTDGDFLLRVGKIKPLTFGLAVDNRTTDDAKVVAAGNLYPSSSFNKGSIVPKYYSQIDGYTQEVVGQSYSAKLVGQGGDPWARDIYGGVQLSALGIRAAEGVLISWTMWCGNDEVEVKWPPKPPLPVANGQVGLPVYTKPIITALSAPGDKNTSPAIVGPFTHGASKLVAISAKVKAATGDPLVAVIFVLPSGLRVVDTNPAGGWSVTVNVGDLNNAGQLLVTAVSQAGISSDVFLGSIQIT